MQSRQTAVCAPVASLSACAAVTWSACTWVSSVYLSARPCSRRRRTSRSTCSATGSISTASWFESSAIRYVRVDDAGSKSCLKNMASFRFGISVRSGAGFQQLRSRARHLDLVQPLERQRPSSIIVQIVLRGRAQVGRVVVGDQQVRDELLPCSRVDLRDPALDHRVAVAHREALQLFLERRGLLQEVPVFLDQESHALRHRYFEPHAFPLAHALEEPRGHLQLADFLAFRLDENRPRGFEALQRAPHQAVEHLLRRLRIPRELAEQRAAVAGEALKIQRLRALCCERGEEPALAAAGCAADYPEAETPRRRLQLRDDFAAVGPVAAFERRRVPAYLAQHVGHRR